MKSWIERKCGVELVDENQGCTNMFGYDVLMMSHKGKSEIKLGVKWMLEMRMDSIHFFPHVS